MKAGAQKKLSDSVLLAIAVGIMAALALFREIWLFPKPDLIPNPDSSWLIYAAGRMLDGAKPYVDVMETNPPLILWISMIPAWLGKISGISPLLVFPVFVTAINLISIALSISILQSQKFLGAKPLFQLVILYVAFTLFVFTPAIYGQRELLFISLVLPYLFKSLGEQGNRQKPLLNAVVILMAAVGFAIKPFFLLLWVMNGLHIAFEKRSLRAAFSTGNWFIGLFQLAYVASVYLITPEYITDIVPALKTTYFTFISPWSAILSPIAKVALITLTVVWLAKLEGDYRRVVMRVAIWLAACVGLLILQRKSWINHLYPMAFMAGLALCITLLYLCAEWKRLRLDIGHRKFIALTISACLLIGSVYLDGVFCYNMVTKPSKLSKKLMVEIENVAAGGYVYPLVNNLQPSFPAIALTGGNFRGGFHHLWPMMGLLIRKQQNDESPELAEVRKWFYDKIVSDFTNYPPKLVWVDDNVNMGEISVYPVNPENRDTIGVLSRDPRFAEIWKNYVKYKEIESEDYPDEEKEKTEEDKLKKPEHYSLYIRK